MSLTVVPAPTSNCTATSSPGRTFSQRVAPRPATTSSTRARTESPGDLAEMATSSTVTYAPSTATGCGAVPEPIAPRSGATPSPAGTEATPCSGTWSQFGYLEGSPLNRSPAATTSSIAVRRLTPETADQGSTLQRPASGS